MNYNKVVKATIEDGGFSELNGNYMVAFEEYEKIVPIEEFTTEVLKEYKETVDKPIGTWYNTENGMIYLDVSIPFEDKKEALQFASDNQQLAIYDIKNDKTINL